jgi:hypothetical protein
MQELCDSIKRPNLQIMGIIGGEEVQAKGIGNIINKIIAENFQISRHRCPSRYKKSQGHQTDMTKIEPFHGIL